MSRQPCSFHTATEATACCGTGSSFVIVEAVGVLVISYELYATGLDLSIGLDLSEQAVLLYVAPSYLKFFDYEDMRARAAVAAIWIRPA